MAEPLTRDEVEGLMSNIGSGWRGARDRAFFAVLVRCGLRCNEARMLDLEDYKASNETPSIRIRYPKGVALGAMPREIGVDPRTRALIEEWLGKRGTSPGPLFVTTKGHRVDNSHWRRRLPRVAARAGISRRVHPHMLRATFARELLDEGASMRHIQLALGHTNLKSTEHYLRGLGDREVIDLTARREW